jgi:hypothetical protein
MMLDKQLLCSDAQTLVLSAGTYLSTNTIDLGAAGTVALSGAAPSFDVGRGEDAAAVGVLAQLTADVTSGGAATLQVNLVMADDAALTSNLTVLQSTPAIALATLKAGYQFRLSTLPPGVTKRYLGFQYIIGTAAITAGAITAGLVANKSTNYAGY